MSAGVARSGSMEKPGHEGSSNRNSQINETKVPNVNFQSDQFWKDFVAGSSRYEDLEMMLLGLALNHGVILDFKGSYLASSPDELSLLNAAKFMGVTMLARDLEKIQI